MPSAVKLNPAIAEAIRQGEAHYLITGATGWFGQVFLDTLITLLGAGQLHRVHAFASREGTVPLRNGIHVPTQPMAALEQLPANKRYALFHFAFLTKEKQDGLPLDDYARINRRLRAQVDAAINRLDLSGMCVTSSGAVYKTTQSLHRDLAAYPYAALKVEDEEFFAARCKEKRVKLIIPRIFNMSGPYINKWNAYALASLLAMALRDEKLVIKARHPVIRSYCYAGDIAAMLLGWMVQAPKEESLTLDACTPGEVEIGELATRICAISGRDPADILREFEPKLSADRYVGNSVAFIEHCARYGIAPLPLDEQVRLTMEDIKERV